MRSLIFLDLHRLSCFISIHAPTRGATVSPVKSLDINKFQSTLPHGERPSSGLDYVLSWYFNPRSRTGSDRAVPDPAPATVHFNPRSRTGSDASNFRPSTFFWYFNPRSRTGSDRVCSRQHGHAAISIHAPARGATPDNRR